MKKMKIIILCIAVLAIILLSFTFFEFLVLKLLGLQYESTQSLVLFFVLYFILQMPILFLVNAIPKALKSVGIVQSSKGLLSFSLFFASIFLFIFLLDIFMETIQITWQGIAVFSFISAIVNVKMNENEDEPPSVDSDDFKELNKKFES